jgi:putative endopeptidase
MKISKSSSCVFFLILMLNSGFVRAVPATGYINKDIPPNVNFFLHANGDWVRNVNSGRAGCFSQEFEKEYQSYIEQCVTGKLPDNNVSKLYTSLMDKDKKEAARLIRSKIWSIIDSTPSISKIPGLIAILNQYGVKNFLDISAVVAPDYDKKWVARVNKTRSIFPMPSNQIVIQDFKLLNETIDDTVANTIRSINDDIADINGPAREDTYKNFYKSGVAKIMNEKGWADYISYSDLNSSKEEVVKIFVDDGSNPPATLPKYLDSFNGVLKKYTIEQWRAYFKYGVLLKYKVTLEDITPEVARNTILQILGDNIEYGDLNSACFEKYVNDHKQKIEDIFNNIKIAYSKAIDNASWMSTATKANANKKLASMQIMIGFSPNYLFSPNRVYSPNYANINYMDPVNNLISIYSQTYKDMLKKLGDLEFGMQMTFIHKSNLIYVPLMMIFNPVYYETDTPAINYGTIGFGIAHEISHAFDDLGRQYNARGEPTPLTSVSEDKNLTKIQQRLTVQYQTLNPDASLQTIREDIADNLGLWMAHTAWQNLSQGRPPEPMFNGIPAGKLFFYGFAHMLRFNTCEDTIHSTDELRTNVPLKNYSGFHNAFGISNGKMYLPQAEQINFSAIP